MNAGRPHAPPEESEGQYRALFDQMAEGFALCEVIRDDGGRVIDWRYVELNAAWEAQTGIARSDALGAAGTELLPGLDRSVIDTFARVVDRGEPAHFEYFVAAIGRWFQVSGYPFGGDRFAVLYHDITERKLVQTALGEVQERQAFLLELSDALRPLSDPLEVQRTALRIVGEHLGIDRMIYAEMEADDAHFRISENYVRNGMSPMTGRLPTVAFGPLTTPLRAGETVVIADVDDSELTGDDRAAYRAGNIAAVVGVPLVKEGRWLSNLSAHMAAPRVWRADEVVLLQETAERTWDAVERARAETAVRVKEEKYRSLFESMDDGFCIIEKVATAPGGPIDFRFIDVNAAFVGQAGVESVIGKTIREVVPDEPESWFETYDRVVTSGEPVRFERVLEANGRTLELYAFPVSGERRQIGVIFKDVTARKQAEATLREREERQRFLLKFSDALRAEEGVTAVGDLAVRMIADELKLDRTYLTSTNPDNDDITVTHDFRRADLPSIIGVHRKSDFATATEEIFERTIVYTDVRTDPRLTELDRQSFAGFGAVGFAAAPIRRGNEGLIWAIGALSTEPRQWTAGEIHLLEEAAERAWAAIERARAETALRESEERFTQFAKASASGIWIRDAETLAMEFVSPAIDAIYGMESDELLGDLKHWASLVLPDDREKALDHIETARGGNATAHEFRVQRPSDGAFRWIRDTNFPLRDDSGAVRRIGGIAEDVTEARLAVEHQAVLLAELQHRVRNIMAIIRSMASRTAESAGSVEEYKALLSGRLLALARVQVLLTRQANGNAELRGLIGDEVSVQAQHEGQYELTGPPVALSPKAAEVLTLAVHELATNALKYGALSAAGGCVRVKWSTFESKGHPWLMLDWEEEGAPPRGPATRRGFGSELIESRIPYELGGTGRLSIEPGGARCHLEFPLVDGESILETGAPVSKTIFGGALDMTGAPDLSGLKVLVIEDDYYLAADTAAALKGAGADVLGPCANEQAARHLLEAETPDAAVVDLNLGGGGPNFELARTLAGRDVPFVFLTGYDSGVIPEDLTAVPRLQKPLELRKVVEAISDLNHRQ